MPMQTTVATQFVGKIAPTQAAYDSFAVTPDDATDLPLNDQGRTVRRIRVTGAGNVNVNLNGGGTAVLTGLSAGQAVLCNVTRILSTSTTATGIVALY